MKCKAPEKRFYDDLRYLNGLFLDLVLEAGAPSAAAGLEPAVRAQLVGLSPRQRAYIAGTPVLLAGFAPVQARHVAEHALPVAESADDRAWWQAAELFSAALMTYLWQVAREDRLNTTLCIGPATEEVDRYRDDAWLSVESADSRAARRLRARFADRPRFWPDLICAARMDDTWCGRVSRLAALPQMLAGLRPSGRSLRQARVC